jgi:hypothetical protein
MVSSAELTAAREVVGRFHRGGATRDEVQAHAPAIQAIIDEGFQPGTEVGDYARSFLLHHMLSSFDEAGQRVPRARSLSGDEGDHFIAAAGGASEADGADPLR